MADKPIDEIRKWIEKMETEGLWDDDGARALAALKRAVDIMVQESQRHWGEPVEGECKELLAILRGETKEPGDGEG